MSRGTAAAQEVRELQLIIVALRADLNRANAENAKWKHDAELAMAEGYNASQRADEAKAENRAMARVVEAARVVRNSNGTEVLCMPRLGLALHELDQVTTP